MKKNKMIIAIRLMLCLLFFAATSTGLCHDHGHEKHEQHHENNEHGIQAADTWIKLVDAKSYLKSWETAASVFKSAVTTDQWSKTMAQVREPLGGLVTRKLYHDQYSETMPGMPDGHYLTLRFLTKFKKNMSGVETVTLVKEGDGIWRVVGYFIK